MLGLKDYDFQKHQDMLKNFFELAENGKTLPGDPPGHLDGWGIGFYKGGRARVHKSGRPVIEEKLEFFETCRRIRTSKILLIHFRKSAWEGTSKAIHAHPFSNGDILFTHNGTIRDFMDLRKEILSAPPPVESKDSEVYFHYVMSFAPLDLIKGFRRAVNHIRARYRYTSLTCLFTDGALLYGFREYTQYPWYYSLYYALDGETKIFSSQPISPDLHWKMLPKGRLLVF